MTISIQLLHDYISPISFPPYMSISVHRLWLHLPHGQPVEHVNQMDLLMTPYSPFTLNKPLTPAGLIGTTRLDNDRCDGLTHLSI